jgi:hypothetical protein
MDHCASDILKKGFLAAEETILFLAWLLQAVIPRELIPIPAKVMLDKNFLRFIYLNVKVGCAFLKVDKYTHIKKNLIILKFHLSKLLFRNKH